MKKIILKYPETTIMILGGGWYMHDGGSDCSLLIFTVLSSCDGDSARGICNHFKG